MEFIKIENLPFQIAIEDLEKEMNYDEIQEYLKTVNSNIRLPNNDELKMIHENKDSIPGMVDLNAYWSSENSTEPDPVYGKNGTAYCMTMVSGIFLNGGRGKRDKCLVRLIKG